MILVDTSIWIDHLRRSDAGLIVLLEEALVMCHPFVIGELALGGLRRPVETLALLADLPQIREADHDEVLRFVSAHRFASAGIGWVDAHLLYSAVIGAHALWTRDKPLRRVADRLGAAYER